MCRKRETGIALIYLSPPPIRCVKLHGAAWNFARLNYSIGGEIRLRRLAQRLPLSNSFAMKNFETSPENQAQTGIGDGERLPISRDTNREFLSKLTFGQKLADHVALFGGSWKFIILFGVILLSWVLLNALILAGRGETFDPYPYILLNLFLSMLAAIQAPIILMSQNRQSIKDRLAAAHDYEVNLKAELEIIGLHEKLDELRDSKWQKLISMQQQQIELLMQLLQERAIR